MARANLALVHPGSPGGRPASSASVHPRPWRTFYYQPRSRISEWSRIGRAATLRGAIRAAVRHLLEGTATSASVCDEDGLERAALFRKGRTIRIVGDW